MLEILLVDDDASLRDTLPAVLEVEGYHVATAANGLEALGYLTQKRRTPPDLILLDMRMPVMDGLTFLETYAGEDHLPAVPIVILSGEPVGDDEMRREGVVLHLQKPVDIASLFSAVERLSLRTGDTEPGPPPSDVRSVLVVEDDDAVREAIAQVLEDDGYRVSLASNGAEALEHLAQATPPRVVLLDLMMPVMTGWEVVDRMRASATLCSIPIVVTSAAADRPPPGVDRIVEKPISLDALLAAVAHYCPSRSGEDRSEEERADDALRKLARRNIELAELQQFRDEMSALIVHDMKSPLSAIISSLGYLLDGPLSEDEDGKRIALVDARDAADRLLRLIRNLLELVKLESGRFVPHRHLVTAADLIVPAVRQRDAVAAAHGVTLVVAEAPRVSMSVDSDLMARAFENIIDNALRHTPRGGRIEVSAEASAGALSIRIGNSGAAIPEAERYRVFEKFAQSGSGARTNLGLGLYFCRLVVEAHGGTIRVEETASLPTTFVLELPY